MFAPGAHKALNVSPCKFRRRKPRTAPCASVRLSLRFEFFMRALHTGSFLFWRHSLSKNSCFNLISLQGPWHLFFGVCFASMASQSISSPRSFLRKTVGPSKGPSEKTSRSKSRKINRSSNLRSLVAVPAPRLYKDYIDQESYKSHFTFPVTFLVYYLAFFAIP